MTIEQVSFTEILDAPNAAELLAEYETECAISAIGPINPNRETYRVLEQNGAMHCFAVYSDSELVGFANVLMTVLPHYSRKVATVESIFVMRAARGRISGLELLRRIEQYALDAGCVGILYSSPAGSAFEALLEVKKTYRRTNTVFFRSL